ncbi:LysR family transcriptional regulator [Streptomyces cinnamoneus]|uniref:LysR family transcriptional regulator n=1 Tax=Streptomyces cinnamoneus TaxID=53446 RepID=UPI003446F90B
MTRPDLNLLVALQALLEERHVSRAAERIGVSQPAASAMLARLRRHFGDDLLVREGNRYRLTPLGQQLQEQTGGVLQLSDRLFATKSHFEPATTEREFTLHVSDYAMAVLGPRLLTAFQERAPHARLRFRQFGTPEAMHDEAGASAVEGLIAPRDSGVSGLPSLALFSDEWVVIADQHHPLTHAAPGADDIGGLRWVLGQFEPRDSRFMLHRLAEGGLQLKPEAVTDSFLALPLYVAGTDRVAVIQRRLTRAVPLPPSLRVLPCPFDAGPINEALWWHPVHTHDTGHRWFRILVHDTARRLEAEEPLVGKAVT